MAANGGGWSCNYSARVYTNPEIPLPIPHFRDGVILRVELHQFLHIHHLQLLISAKPKESFKCFHLPPCCFFSMERFIFTVSNILQRYRIPATDQDSLARSLLLFCRRLRGSSDVSWVTLGLDFEVVTELRNEAEFLDWCNGGTMNSVVVRTLRATKPAIDGLEKTNFKASNCNSVDHECCMVCLEEFEDDEQVTMLPCLHGYHQSCITEWLKTNHRCPICRYPMPWVLCDGIDDTPENLMFANVHC